MLYLRAILLEEKEQTGSLKRNGAAVTLAMMSQCNEYYLSAVVLLGGPFLIRFHCTNFTILLHQAIWNRNNNIAIDWTNAMFEDRNIAYFSNWNRTLIHLLVTSAWAANFILFSYHVSCGATNTNSHGKALLEEMTQKTKTGTTTMSIVFVRGCCTMTAAPPIKNILFH